MEHKVNWGIKQLNSNYNYQILWFTFSSNVKQEVSLLDKKAFTHPSHHHAPPQLVGWREQGHTDQQEAQAGGVEGSSLLSQKQSQQPAFGGTQTPLQKPHSDPKDSA